MIGPVILFVGPVIALSGAGLLSFLHGKVAEPPTCQACGKISSWGGEVIVLVRDPMLTRHAA